MTIDLSYGDEQYDEDWGAVFAEVKKSSGSDNIFVCHTTVNDLSKIANELSKAVVDKSWVVELYKEDFGSVLTPVQASIRQAVGTH